MRTYVVLLAAWLLAAGIAGASNPSSPGREAIIEILTKAKSWTVYIEHGGGDKPSDRAGVQKYQFFRRGSEVVGRTMQLAPGFNGEFKVIVHDNGFDFERCCRYPPGTPMTSIDYDPNDKTYPFKRADTPQKWWFSPEP
jgi:hypothetical protein